MSRHSRNVVLSNLQCPSCLNVVQIPRPKGLRREDNHVKHMWCFKCKEETGHIEQRQEFNLMKKEA